MVKDFFKMMCKLILALYIGVVITYLLHDLTHSLFGCKIHNIIGEWWECVPLHFITSIAFGFFICCVLLVFFLEKDRFSNDD